MRKILILIPVLSASLFLVAFFGDKPALSPSKTGDLWVEMTAEQARSSIIPLPSLAPLVNRVKPAVLVVTTESVTQPGRQPQVPPGFEEFFRMPQQPQKSTGLGSGFIIHPSGIALTNNHVIEGATKIKIKVGGDLKEYDAEVIGADPDTDIALIQIKSDKKDWPVIPLGSSTAVQIGDFAMAIGNPLGLEHSISFGPISARGRRDIQPSGKRGLFDFMQLSAPINPGNSGGALLNMSGEVIGINTAISASGQGIAFAIPIDQVKHILPQLKKTGKASRSGMGVKIENVSSDLAKELGLPYAQGALVREVLPGSAAAKAGIQPGDVITEFDGKAIVDANNLQLEAGLAGVGKSVPLKVFRNRKYLSLRLTLETLNKEEPLKKADLKGLEELGISVASYKDQVLQGAKIVKVDPRSMAAMSGIEKDDIIIKVNNQPIKNAESLASLVKKIPERGILRILMKRQQRTLFVVLQKP
ncbi:MAG: trypsin-like peptidase domain-containing protein [Myxococcaceae bacterium]